MRPNKLRELLRAGKPTLGTHIHSAWPATIELVGHSGLFDYVEFAGEYAPYDLFALENLARAVDTFPHLSAMMKIEQQPRTYLGVRAIGSGIQNLLFADPRTPADVAECVAAVRAEVPGHGGVHGVGMRRDVGYVIDVGSPAFVQALDDAVVAVMIEKAPAVENLEDLLAVKGVDMVQFGPADYSISIGLPGAVGPSAGRGGRAADDPDGARRWHRAAGGDQPTRPGQAISRSGRPSFLHGVGRRDPLRVVQTRGRHHAQDPGGPVRCEHRSTRARDVSGRAQPLNPRRAKVRRSSG